MSFVAFFTHIEVGTPYPRWICWVCIALITLITEFVKLPYKHFTKKVPNENLRKKLNIAIMLIPICGGLCASVCLMWLTHYGFSLETAISWGLYSQVIYVFISNIYKRIKNGGDVTMATLEEDFQNAKKEVDENKDELKQLVEGKEFTGIKVACDNGDEEEDDEDDEEEDLTADDKFVSLIEEIKSFK